jgi:signal transduction histidine kinase/ActR/RegA family two-component response regulator
VREALQLRRESSQPSSQAQRLLLEQVVRTQDAHLRLARRDFWEFDETIRDITRTAAHTLDVRRVSLWEVEPSTQKLKCALVYDTESGTHEVHDEIEMPPRYLEALEQAMFVAVADAQHDPRTSELSDGYLAVLGISSLLDAPVRREGKIVGVVCHEHIGPLREWSIIEQCAAASFADIVARALEVRDRRRAEARLRESEKFEVIGRLAGRVAHDFNNLLTIIVGNAELGLMRSAAGAADIAGLEQIAQAAEEAGALIRQLSSYARREITATKPIDIVARVAEVRGLVQRLLGRDVKVSFDCAPGPLWVSIDPTRLQQVLLNLAANARDAMEQGGEFVLSLERVRQRYSAEDDEQEYARLRVRDSGVGIEAKVLPRIFEPFFTTKLSKVGTGLGLASVGEIVRQAGGRISVASKPNEGATFEILLPLAEPEELEQGVETSATLIPQQPRKNARPIVLLVEAQPQVRQVFAQELAEAGLKIVEVSSAIEALELHARGKSFDWIASEYALPQLDGARLIEQLRDFRPGAPALLIADFGTFPDAELERLKRGGPTYLLTKPIALAGLRSAIESLRSQPSVS